MAKYILTKEFSPINERYGILQNLSGDSNIEITSDTNGAGIILKPFQTIFVDTKVYARQSSGGGTCQLVSLSFGKNAPSSVGCHKPKCSGGYNPYDDFDDEFFCDEQSDKDQPLSVQETDSHFLVGISKESLNGQKNFLIQFED